MKSRGEYIRREWAKEFRGQLTAQKRFKRLVDQWIELGFDRSRMTIGIANSEAIR